MKNLSAKELAAKLHLQPSSEQRYGGEPYTKHLDDVVANGKRYLYYIEEPNKIDVLNALRLHDIVEDTEMTPRKLANLFSTRVAEIVTKVSNVREIDKVKELYLTLVNIRGDYEATFVKICDRIANGTNSRLTSDTKGNKMYIRYMNVYPTFRYALKIGTQFENMWKELDLLFQFNENTFDYNEINDLRQSFIEGAFHMSDDEAFTYTLQFLHDNPVFEQYIRFHHHLTESLKRKEIAEFIMSNKLI